MTNLPLAPHALRHLDEHGTVNVLVPMEPQPDELRHFDSPDHSIIVRKGDDGLLHLLDFCIKDGPWFNAPFKPGDVVRAIDPTPPIANGVSDGAAYDIEHKLTVLSCTAVKVAEMDKAAWAATGDDFWMDSATENDWVAKNSNAAYAWLVALERKDE